MTTPPDHRKRAWEQLSGEVFDLLIVGGGIVGAGVARDAAMRGLRTVLLDQHDFAFGTSSRSSRLLHGGLRYLAQGRLGLVREASVEKLILQRIAPHLADPLPFLFPTYRHNPDWKLWQLKIGVKVYDLLSGGRNFAPSSWLGCEPLLRKVPELARDGLCGAVRYYDGFTNDARLTMDTIRSAARAGAVVLNYCQFLDANAGQTWAASVRDHLTDQTCRVQARNIVNATGPWADVVAHSAVKLRLTKGIHLVLNRARLPVPEVVVMTEGKRILFAIPWGERTILGTTDTDYTGEPEHVSTEAADIAYVLNIANRFFPLLKLNPADVLSSWAGLRPLLADAHGKPSDISRSHEIRSPEPGWWDVAGGKLTTYRLMAEQTVDRIVRRLADHKRFASCRTAVEPLLPPEETRNISGIIPPPLNPALVEHHCAREWAVHLDDVMLRRSGWHHYERDADRKAEQVAAWMAGFLGWSEGQREAELRRYREMVGRASVPLATPPRK